MRITTANQYDSAIETLQRRQREMSDAQTQLTSGQRVNRASDDPTAAARAERALATEARTVASQRAVDASRNAMTLAESALADGGELLQGMREVLVQAGNASYSDTERASLAERLAALRQQLLAVANRGDGNGGFLFAGQGSTQQPFLDAAGGVQYRGINGEMQAASGEALPLTVDGAAAWLQARSGNGVFETRAVSSSTAWVDGGRVTDAAALTGSTYTVQFSVAGGSTTYAILQDGNPTAVTAAPYVSGQAIEVDGMSLRISGSPANGDSFEAAPAAPDLSVFDTLDRAIAELRQPGRTPAQVTQGVQRGLRDLDQSLNALQSLRSRVGETMSLADGVDDRLEDLKLHAKSERADAVDLDMVEAISNFQNQQSGYDAALKTYASVQRMSLFQYLQT
jgi:flagellar hook-associated protein 3 FlgL